MFQLNFIRKFLWHVLSLQKSEPSRLCNNWTCVRFFLFCFLSANNSRRARKSALCIWRGHAVCVNIERICILAQSFSCQLRAFRTIEAVGFPYFNAPADHFKVDPGFTAFYQLPTLVRNRFRAKLQLFNETTSKEIVAKHVMAFFVSSTSSRMNLTNDMLFPHILQISKGFNWKLWLWAKWVRQSSSAY